MKYDMKNILFSLFVFPLVCPVAAQTADTDRPVVDNTIALREIQSSFFFCLYTKDIPSHFSE